MLSSRSHTSIAQVAVFTGSFLQNHLLNAFSGRSPNRYRQRRQIQSATGRRQVAKPIEYEPADGIDAFGFNVEAEMFAQVVESRVSTDQKFSAFQRLDVEILVSS